MDTRNLSGEDLYRLIKRVRQIAQEIDTDYTEDYKEIPLDTLAFRLKILASPYNCYIQSWVTTDSGGMSSVVECYCASNYIEEKEDTWELISSDNEPMAIIVAFKWLADRGYFKPELKQIETDDA